MCLIQSPCTVDEKGRVYVCCQPRGGKWRIWTFVSNTMWIPDDVGLSSVEEKSEFLKRELLQGSSACLAAD